MNIKEILNWAVLTLKEENIENPRLDAEIMLTDALLINKIDILTHDERELTQDEQSKYKSMVKRRKNHEPIAYITGRKEFYGRDFLVDKSVLIPRPDTEILVETVIERFKDAKNLKILDMCAGSGCIGLTLAKELDAVVTLCDISKDAATVIRKNAVALGLRDTVNIVTGDLFENIRDKFNIIVSNPPYIPTSVIGTLEKDVAFEPKLALDGGKDGLMFYKKIIVTAKDFLADDGALCFEIGIDELEGVKKLMLENNYCDVKSFEDLAGISRVVTCKKQVRI